MNVILYSTHCPKCNVLETKLKNKNIDFSEINDENIMIEKGFMSIPILEVDEEIMDFISANRWIDEQ